MIGEILDFFESDGFIALYALTLFLSLYKYGNYFETILKYFPILICYTFLTEILGYLIKRNENFQLIYIDGFSIENSIVYNIFDVILFLYFYFVYWKILKSPQHKKVVLWGALAFILISIVNLFIQDFMLLPQIYSLTIGSLVLVVSVILYLKELNSISSGLPKTRNLLFWISIGLLVFYSVYPLIMILGIYFGDLYRDLLIRKFHLFSISFMYICFIIGFLRMRRVKSVHS